MKIINSKNKYVVIEVAFFVTFFFLFPILTDIEYDLKEPPCPGCERSFLNNVLQRFVFGAFRILPYIFLYKIIISKLLLRKKYLLFLPAFILFLFALDYYIVYVEYWTISRLTFLPGNITKDAATWFGNKHFFHFSVIYVINQTLAFTALAYFINYTKQEEKMNALKQAKLETDLNFLKAQIQPHFFFNTLNNIYSLAQQRSELTASLVEKLSLMMRYIIYDTSGQKVLLQSEIDFLRSYVDVESIRYGSNIAINFETQGITAYALIEPLLLLPFIENMFKHGIQNETGKGFIEIVICLSGNELTMETRNSKPALLPGETDVSGIGMTNASKRLELLYPGKHSLTAKDSERKYEVFLTLQLS